jgi:hypothetical protein
MSIPAFSHHVNERSNSAYSPQHKTIFYLNNEYSLIAACLGEARTQFVGRLVEITRRSGLPFQSGFSFFGQSVHIGQCSTLIDRLQAYAPQGVQHG